MFTNFDFDSINIFVTVGGSIGLIVGFLLGEYFYQIMERPVASWEFQMGSTIMGVCMVVGSILGALVERVWNLI